MDDTPERLPAVLANAWTVEATPDVERAIAEAEDAIADGRLMPFGSDGEYEAFLAGVAWQARQGATERDIVTDPA